MEKKITFQKTLKLINHLFDLHSPQSSERSLYVLNKHQYSSLLHFNSSVMGSVVLLRDIFSLKCDFFVCTLSTKSTFLCCYKGVCDGAGAVIIASESALKKHNLTPLARIVAYHSSGCDPSIMGIGKLQENAFSVIALSTVKFFFCWAF